MDSESVLPYPVAGHHSKEVLLPSYPGQISQMEPYQGVPQSLPTPPLNDMNSFPGYENLAFDEMPSAPPPYFEQYPQPKREEFSNIPQLNHQELREALISYTSDHCCYADGAAKDMELVGMNFKSIFHYSLETFTEKRITGRSYKSYNGETIDSGTPPGPWEILVTPKQRFFADKTTLEVPFTSSVRMCFQCIGAGTIICVQCNGIGNRQCFSCNGLGYNRNGDEQRSCLSCSGAGRSCCPYCSGRGRNTCLACFGSTRLRHFIMLKVEWFNHLEDHISESPFIPEEKIRKVTGQIILDENFPRASPITNFPEESINMVSQQLVTKHQSCFAAEKILEQRQRVKIIPTTEVQYIWNQKMGHFQVYGFERKVYFPDYPQKCFCCNIL